MTFHWMVTLCYFVNRLQKLELLYIILIQLGAIDSVA